MVDSTLLSRSAYHAASEEGSVPTTNDASDRIATSSSPPPPSSSSSSSDSGSISDFSSPSPSPLRRAILSPLSLLSLLPLPSFQQLLLRTLSLGPIPRHVAFVMDGNRRWATSSGSSVRHGHLSGFHTLKHILQVCLDLRGLDTVTVYAFAIDNFKRNADEVHALMDIAKTRLLELVGHGQVVARYQVRVRIVGRKHLLPPDVLAAVQRVEHMTRHHRNATLNICMPYASRDEMAGAVCTSVDRKLARLQRDWHKTSAADPSTSDHPSPVPTTPAAAAPPPPSGPALPSEPPSSQEPSLPPSDPPSSQPPPPLPPSNPPTDPLLSTFDAAITPHALSASMQLSDSPPLDLLIRTSGVSRLSDFMLWQCTQHTHLHFVDKYWPQFGVADMVPIILEWQRYQVARSVQRWCGWQEEEDEGEGEGPDRARAKRA